MPKVDEIHRWIVEIDEINVYKNHSIFELKALRGRMNVTEQQTTFMMPIFLLILFMGVE